MREYREREAAEGPLSTEDLPPDAFRAVEQTTTADSRQFAAFAATISAAPDQVRMPCAAWNRSRDPVRGDAAGLLEHNQCASDHSATRGRLHHILLPPTAFPFRLLRSTHRRCLQQVARLPTHLQVLADRLVPSNAAQHR